MSDRLEAAASGRTGPTKGFGAWIAGRGRREYWLFVVPLIVVLLALELAGVAVAGLIVGLPMLLVWIRRLHDLGRSGWVAPVINIVSNGINWSLIAFATAEIAAMASSVIFLGVIVTLGAIPGQAKSNAYGPPPGKIGDLAETFN
jgi:uncharacterized membrane protein YhaH (DUF805 family)